MSKLIHNETTEYLDTLCIGANRVDDYCDKKTGRIFPCYKMSGNINTQEGWNKSARESAVTHLIQAGVEPTEEHISEYYNMIYAMIFDESFAHYRTGDFFKTIRNYINRKDSVSV